MARKQDNEQTPEPSSAGVPAKSLAHLKAAREKIDKLDHQIIKSINERAQLAAEIGQIKAAAGEEIFNPAREEEVLTNVLEVHKKLGGTLGQATIRAIFRELMSGTRALQKVHKVAFLGPEYSFSHIAAVERFGTAVEFVPVGSIAAVFESVNRGHSDFGVVPVENSTDGRVTDTLDMFLRMSQMIICAEIRLNVHHNLLARCEPHEIRRVYSKPQALSQCRNWLAKNAPQAVLKDVSSTAIAAELAQKEPGAAAVASREAAVYYGLRILFSDIEDQPDNETRFAVIGNHKCSRTGHDKTSVIFRVPHNPGSLVEALEIFRSAKINLTWIESFPARTAKGDKQEYIFFVDFEGHQEDSKIAKTLKTLESYCKEMHILGSFPFARIQA